MKCAVLFQLFNMQKHTLTCPVIDKPVAHVIIVLHVFKAQSPRPPKTNWLSHLHFMLHWVRSQPWVGPGIPVFLDTVGQLILVRVS